MTLATPQFKVDHQLFESVQWHVTKTPSSLKTPPYHESLAVLKILTFVYQGKRDNVVTAFKYLKVNSSSSLLPINPHQESQETLQENYQISYQLQIILPLLFQPRCSTLKLLKQSNHPISNPGVIQAWCRQGLGEERVASTLEYPRDINETLK